MEVFSYEPSKNYHLQLRSVKKWTLGAKMEVFSYEPSKIYTLQLRIEKGRVIIYTLR